MKNNVVSASIGLGATLVLSGCSGLSSGGFQNPYTERVNQLESKVSATITSCGGSWDFPPQVTIRNGNDELIDYTVYIGYFDEEGVLIDDNSASAKVPANKVARTESFRGSDSNWSTCEITDTLLLPDE